MLSGQSSDTRSPVWISLLEAAATTAGVSMFRAPSESLAPYRPHAFPAGPLGSRGRDENGGLGGGAAIVITRSRVHGQIQVGLPINYLQMTLISPVGDERIVKFSALSPCASPGRPARNGVVSELLDTPQ